jgi:hypothetical protein
MDEIDLLAAYVRKLEEALTRAGRPTQPLVAEAAAHLCEDAARIARREGCSDAEAARRAIARFGDVSSVVAASRKLGHALAASAARISSAVLLAMLAWEVFRAIIDESLWRGGPTCRPPEWIGASLLFAELTVTSIWLLRALAGRGTTRVLSVVLLLNATFAFAMFAGAFAMNVQHQLAGRGHVNLLWALTADAEAPWALIVMQCLAGLRALRARRDPDGALLA